MSKFDLEKKSIFEGPTKSELFQKDPELIVEALRLEK